MTYTCASDACFCACVPVIVYLCVCPVPVLALCPLCMPTNYVRVYVCPLSVPVARVRPSFVSIFRVCVLDLFSAIYVVGVSPWFVRVWPCACASVSYTRLVFVSP